MNLKRYFTLPLVLGALSLPLFYTSLRLAYDARRVEEAIDYLRGVEGEIPQRVKDIPWETLTPGDQIQALEDIVEEGEWYIHQAFRIPLPSKELKEIEDYFNWLMESNLYRRVSDGRVTPDDIRWAEEEWELTISDLKRNLEQYAKREREVAGAARSLALGLAVFALYASYVRKREEEEA